MKIIDEKGFTLIELLITVVVFGIIASMAAPAFSSIMKGQNLNKSTRELTFIFSEARAKAAAERRQIEVVLNSVSTATLLNNTETQMNWKPTGKVTLKSGSPTSVIFLPTGLVQSVSDVTFEICEEASSATSKKIIISRLGTIQTLVGGAC